jgi:hypothetical protein
MSEFEEQSINAFRTLFEKVDTLRHIHIQDIVKPEVYQLYEDTLQHAYDAMTRVEDALTALGMKLEYEHFRLGGAVDELQPLMIHPRSKSEKVMEILVEKMPALDSNADRASHIPQMVSISLHCVVKRWESLNCLMRQFRVIPCLAKNSVSRP